MKRQDDRLSTYIEYVDDRLDVIFELVSALTKEIAEMRAWRDETHGWCGKTQVLLKDHQGRIIKLTRRLSRLEAA